MASGNMAGGNTAADAVIVGAGVMGASCAMHLASAGLRKLLVVEKGRGVGSGSTGRSTAIIRQTYSNYEVSLMAKEALGCFQNWRDFVELPETRANFIAPGVLFLFRKDDQGLASILELHRRVGIRSTVLSGGDKARMFPDLDFAAAPPEEVAALEAGGAEPEPHEAQALFEHDGGFADPVGTAEDMLDAARALGAQARFNTAVTAIGHQGGRVTGVTLATAGGAERVSTPLVINCAGPWSMGLDAAVGFPLPHELVATRIQVVTKHFGEKLKGPLPVMADMVTGFYGRLEAGGRQVVLGSVLEEDEREAVADPDDYNEVADAPFRERILTLLHHRVPTFKTRGRVSSYAGLYTVNRVDSHPIIDESELLGYYNVNGWSGHGFKLSPIAGNLLTYKVLGQWGRGKSEVPPGFFARDRQPLTTHWGGVIA
ncbi:MAG: FAD-dependent oxidoreductase [SAR324 cluster bacterium]|nr:FAD-dependent oxidoreductase [SAR324 cluster bacterium]